MTEEPKICVKHILGKIGKFILTLVGLGIIFLIGMFFILPYYLKYDYMKECLKEKHSESWCEETWTDFEKMD
jgi:hypothetical protein